MTCPFTHIIFGGGGFSGLSYLGIIRYLQQEGFDKQIVNVAGTSFGSAMALFYVLNIPFGFLEKTIRNIINDDELTNIELDWIKWMETSGFIQASVFNKLCEKFMNTKMTFLELAKLTGKNLVVVATKLPEVEPVYFSVDTTPNVMVLDAVYASCSIPCFYNYCKIGKDIFVDGGLCSNVPIFAFPNVDINKMLVVFISLQKETTVNENIDILGMLKYILLATNKHIGHHIVIKNNGYTYIEFDTHFINTIPIDSYTSEKLLLKITAEQLDNSIQMGYEKAHNLFRKFFTSGS